MKVERINNYNGTHPILRDLDAGECAWIQQFEEPEVPFDILVMVTNVENNGKSYVCLENGYTRLPGNCFMNYPCIPDNNVKIVGSK